MFKKIISVITLSLLLFPSTISASSFGIDQNLSITPSNDTLDFGEININTSKTLNFTLSNTGENYRLVQVLSDPVPPFYLSGESLSLDKNSTKDLEIEFRPYSVGKFKEEFKVKEIHTNEIKTLTIEGESINPNYQDNTSNNNDNTSTYYSDEIYYSPEDTLDFPDTVEDYSSEMYIAITNNKNSRQTIRVINSPDDEFDLVSSSSQRLEELETGYFLIRFTPSRDRSYRDTITFEDSDDDRVSIELKGEGIETSDTFEFQVPNKKINPDTNQKIYFNFKLKKESDITIKIKKNGTTIYTKTDNNERSGRKNRNYYWDGEDDDNDQVSDGTYQYEVKIEDEDDNETYTGTITVDTNVETGDFRYRNVDGFPLYPTYKSTTPQDLDPLTTNESLIYRLKATPDYLNQNQEDVDISFEATQDGQATVRIYDENNTRKLTLATDNDLNKGYHKNEYTWEDTEISNHDASDGKYIIKVTFTADNGDVDTDIVYVNLNRDGDLEEGNFDPPYPNYDNTYQEYYNEFENEFGYVPSCTVMVDIPENSYTCAAAKFVFDQGIIMGNTVNEEVFLRPNDPLTRAEALTVILRVMGMELETYNASRDGNLGFKDLNKKGWYAPYVKTMIKTASKSKKLIGKSAPVILKGYSDGTLRPNNEITRAEFYKIYLESARQSENIRANFNLDYELRYKPFLDVEGTDWFAPYAEFTKRYLANSQFAQNYFNTYELISNDTSFYPNAAITRKEVIELLFETERLNLIQF